MKRLIALTRVVALALALILMLCGGYLLLEGIYVGLLASEQSLQGFRFGDPSWVQGGGWRFTSRGHFLLSGFLKSLTLLIPAGVTLYWVIRTGRRQTAA